MQMEPGCTFWGCGTPPALWDPGGAAPVMGVWLYPTGGCSDTPVPWLSPLSPFPDMAGAVSFAPCALFPQAGSCLLLTPLL